MPYRNQEDIGCRAGARRVLRGVLGVCLVAAIGVLGAAGVRSAESWQILLTHQLKEQQRCILSEVLFANEIRVGERVGLVGRIRCSDAREYDFEQQQTNQPFVIRLCQPAVC
jgi:hypothetical protein